MNVVDGVYCSRCCLADGLNMVECELIYSYSVAAAWAEAVSIEQLAEPLTGVEIMLHAAAEDAVSMTQYFLSIFF